MSETKKSTFEIFNSINVDSRLKQKMGLNYLGWADAWTFLKKVDPDAFYTIYTRELRITKSVTTTDADTNTTTTITYDEGVQEIPYFTDGNTGFVKIGVTAFGVEYVEIYPIMDLKNNSVKLRNIGMTDVNKALQRGFVKCVARHGLGLYVYRGEEFGEEEEVEEEVAITISQSKEFEVVKKEVIEVATFLIKKTNEEAIRYIKEMFPGVRLSETTNEHLDNLIKAREYLYKLYTGE